MSGKLRVLISAILMTPAAALGLGLGEIRLNSSLNEPLSAEIDLVAATPEELATLNAGLASAEIFSRYGLDRPAFLSALQFTVGRGQDGRAVLLVRSREAISEPFVSFLVDVNWPRGRLLREYTVLLDPPAMLAAGDGPAPEPVAAPTTAPSAQAPSTPPAAAEPVPEPAPGPAQAPATAAAPSMPATGADSSYQVERGDTLYRIAGGIAGGDRQAIERTMIALFRANPEAFDGNINQLRAGAILRVPSSDDIAGVDQGEASSEVRRQNSAWRASVGVEDAGRLKLVTPAEGEAEAAAASEPGAAESSVDALEQDVNEQRRLIELQNQELAALQKKLAEARAQAAAQAAPPPAPPAAPEAPLDEAPVAPEDDVTQPSEPPAAAPEPATPAPAPAAEAEDGRSFLDTLTDNWMMLLGAAGLLVLGLLGFNFYRRRRDEDVSGALKGFDLPATAPIPTETQRLRALATGERTAEMPRPPMFADQDDDEDADIVVEERPVARPRAETRPVAGHEETISAEAALDLDQADPLAEADFHMAYGLYDQAVDLVRMALQKEPQRHDLKLKLAEIHFVAGDTAQFLAVARDLKKELGSGPDWDRIVIMGRQLAPDEPMFAGAVQDAGVDLSLEGGDNMVDLDLLSAPEGDEGLDLDLGKVAAASDAEATGENTALEFDLGDGSMSLGTTQDIGGREGGGTVEMPTLEIPTSETPTVETPALKAGQAARDRMQPATTDSTAEMAIDDLGLDLGNLDNLPDIDDATAIATGMHDDMTQIAHRSDATAIVPRDTADDATALMPRDAGATAVLPQVDFGEIDLDIGEATDTPDESPTVRDTLKTEQMSQLSQLEPVTMSEVGTKLDLARAYMDMGDPDGARNILQEVLAEGSASQKQEARRLIDTLPGA
jgi:pilus assembly protein FimV